jgi:hypothetical protein
VRREGCGKEAGRLAGEDEVEEVLAHGAAEADGRALQFGEGSAPRRSWVPVEAVGQVFRGALEQAMAMLHFPWGFFLGGHPWLSVEVVTNRSADFPEESTTPSLSLSKPVVHPKK